MKTMPIHILHPQSNIDFPPVETAKHSGLLAVGGDLSSARILSAYMNGIFPWYGEGCPIMWWSPNPRCILIPSELKVSKSLEKIINKNIFTIKQNTAFSQVINYCSQMPRPGQNGTWLVPEMIEAYNKLHREGFAHSIEAWKNGVLVGGLYGIALGKVFFGESMFHLEANASKVAFVSFVRYMQRTGFSLVDCQQTTPHMLAFGAKEISRSLFIALLKKGLRPLLK